MSIYLYFRPDFDKKQEYFVSEIKDDLYELLVNYINNTSYYISELNLGDIRKYNKIVISYPVFDYNRAGIGDYPEDVVDKINDILYDEKSTFKDNLIDDDLNFKWSRINNISCILSNSTIHSIIDILNKHETIHKIPKEKYGNIYYDITIEKTNNLSLANKIEDFSIPIPFTIKNIDNVTDVYIMWHYRDYYLPLAFINNNLESISDTYFNDTELLKSLIKEINPNTNVCNIGNRLSIDTIKFNSLCLRNVSNSEFPKYAYYPLNNDKEAITKYGSIDNMFFESKTSAILYGSRFSDIEIYDKSIIPYINSGKSFNIQLIDFDVLNQIKNIDEMLEKMKYNKDMISTQKDNNVKTNKTIKKSINTLANSQIKASENIKAGLNTHGDKISNAINNMGNNIGDSIMTAGRIVAKSKSDISIFLQSMNCNKNKDK